MRQILLVLHDIRSAHNVGAIFRTADGAGMTKIYLTGYTPAPTDQFNRPNKEIAKTALGAEQTLPWEKWENILELIASLKKDGYQMVAVEQAPNSIDYRKVKLAERAAIIIGNEVEGVAPEILKACDIIAEIPMRGQKESLNVSVATGIALFRLLDH